MQHRKLLFFLLHGFEITLGQGINKTLVQKDRRQVKALGGSQPSLITLFSLMDTFLVYLIGATTIMSAWLFTTILLKKSSNHLITLSKNPVLRGERGKKQQVFLILLIVVAVIVVELIS
jgi:hypothetical protein